MYQRREQSFLAKRASLKICFDGYRVTGTVMRISGISLKNGSRPLWIPSDSNDRSSLQVEARTATVARDTRRWWFGGAARDDRSSRKKKATAVPVCGSHYCKTRMDDIRGGNVEARGEKSRQRCQLCDRARRATPDLRANFSRDRELLRERNRKGTGIRERRGCIILTTLRKLW